MKPALLENFAVMREKNLMDLKEAKESGRKAVGMYCLYSPAEVVIAAGAIPLPLCGTKQDPVPAAEKVLPRNLCPLIKSSYGFAVTDTCPFFYFSDMLIAENTCDGKKKMYELLGEIKPLHLLQLPQTQEGERARQYWVSEVTALKERLESEFGVTITEADLRGAIKLMNAERRALKALQDTAKLKPAPMSGHDILTVLFNKGFATDKQAAIDLVYELVEQANEIAKQGQSPFTEKTPRILLTGVPVGLGSDKVVKLVEECGGNVVCFQSCGAYKGVVSMVDEDQDPIEAIADKYLSTPCSCMSPNTARFELDSRLIEEFQVDGVIDLTWQGCHTYNIESYSLRNYLKERHDIPFLQIETDYSDSDKEQLKVRIEAFLEMMS